MANLSATPEPGYNGVEGRVGSHYRSMAQTAERMSSRSGSQVAGNRGISAPTSRFVGSTQK